jgi:hypothetical protein
MIVDDLDMLEMEKDGTSDVGVAAEGDAGASLKLMQSKVSTLLESK